MSWGGKGELGGRGRGQEGRNEGWMKAGWWKITLRF